MKPLTRQYVFAVIFIGVAIYQLVQKDYLEVYLYGAAGLAFIANTLTMEPKLYAYKKALVVISWLLIIATGLIFLYLLQFKYF